MDFTKYGKAFSKGNKGTRNWKKKLTFVHSLKSYKGLRWEISAYLLSIFFLADRFAFLVHFLCVPKVVQWSEVDSEIEDITWPRGEADLRTLTILPWVSRFFNFSHGLTTPNLTVFWEISFWKLKRNNTSLNKNESFAGNASACLSFDGALKHFSHEVRLSGKNAALCYMFLPSDDLFPGLLNSSK